MEVTNDRCCRSCRSSLPDICRESRDCWCHIEARAHDRVAKPDRPTHRDPTAGEALGNLVREERRKRGRRGG
jgi:hypothetical protein